MSGIVTVPTAGRPGPNKPQSGTSVQAHPRGFLLRSLLRFWPFNAIALIDRLDVIFANQDSLRCRRSAGGSGFGYMRDGQKKKYHECCAAHFPFIA
jgi:hypothetical protein